MVKLDQITTGTGDQGTTSLADGTRVAKSDPRVCAYGTVDELNSLLGVVLLEDLPGEAVEELRRVQNDLFDLGADIASPSDEKKAPVPRIDKNQVGRLEGVIRRVVGQLHPAESFVLPGGSRSAAYLHLARAVARRAEREALFLAGTSRGEDGSSVEKVNPLILTYLNRLSDLLFVFARLCNACGREDIPWIPGRHR